MNYCETCGKPHNEPGPDCKVCVEWWEENQLKLPLPTPDPAAHIVRDIVELSPAERQLIHAH